MSDDGYAYSRVGNYIVRTWKRTLLFVMIAIATAVVNQIWEEPDTFLGDVFRYSLIAFIAFLLLDFSELFMGRAKERMEEEQMKEQMNRQFVHGKHISQLYFPVVL